MKKVIIIQARMGSTRLPGKVMMKLKGKSMLEQLINRLRNCINVDDIIVATSVEEKDDSIEQECKRINVNCFRGSEDNVLSRYYYAAKESNADVIIRITADCPVMDYKIIDNMLEKFMKSNTDYMSNFDILENTFPRGMDVEIISKNALDKTYKEATQEFEKEHVTPYIYRNPDKFILMGYSNSRDLSNYRFTVDTKEDFELIQIIYDNLYDFNKEFSMEDIVDFIDRNPNLKHINEYVKQKPIN